MSSAPALNDKRLVLECFGAADLAVKTEVLIVVMEVERVDAVGFLMPPVGVNTPSHFALDRLVTVGYVGEIVVWVELDRLCPQ